MKQNIFALSIIYKSPVGQGSRITCFWLFEDPFILHIQWHSMYSLVLVKRIHVKTEMLLILDISIVKQYVDKWLKQPLKTHSNRYHIAYIMFTKAIMIINEYVFAIAENKIVAKCKLWVLSITLPLINSACLMQLTLYMPSKQAVMCRRNGTDTGPIRAHYVRFQMRTVLTTKLDLPRYFCLQRYMNDTM